MRRIINSTFVSIDGVINHMEAWHFGYVDEEAAQIATDQLLACDALLMGRRTYEVYAQSWPDRDGVYASKINGMRKYVASTTLEQADWAGTEVISSDLPKEVARLKEQPGGDILMHGFGPVARTLLAHACSMSSTTGCTPSSLASAPPATCCSARAPPPGWSCWAPAPSPPAS